MNKTGRNQHCTANRRRVSGSLCDSLVRTAASAIGYRLAQKLHLHRSLECYSDRKITGDAWMMLNHAWGREAFERFPELIDRFDDTDTPCLLWFELSDAFKTAYKSPRNEDLISRIYAFADWCCSQPEGATSEDDLGTAVAVCFYEHIPESPEAVEDMPRWFSRSDVLGTKDIFSYMVGEEGFQRILRVYLRHYQQQKKSSRRKQRKRGHKS